MKKQILIAGCILMASTSLFAATETSQIDINDLKGYFVSIEILIAGALILTDVLKNLLKLGSQGTKILSWAIPFAAPWIGFVFKIEGFLSGFEWWHVLLASGIAAAVANKVAELELLRMLFSLITGKPLDKVRAYRPK